MKLFVVYIGGSHEQSMIELHDIRIVVAETIEDTYDELKRSWWGIPSSLHLDAWGCLLYADGYDINVKNTPPDDLENKLYFINLGGYDKNEFTELHKNIFVVAENDTQAKRKALEHIQAWESPHRDNQFDVETMINVSDVVAGENFFIHLSLSTIKIPFDFTCKYIPIGKI